jgi:hypothetical protein
MRLTSMLVDIPAAQHSTIFFIIALQYYYGYQRK